jgi:hypothetical protein
MKIITSRVHGVIDYLMVIIMLASPWLFHFNEIRIAKGLILTLASFQLFMGFFTNYELGLRKAFSFRAHLTTDIILGIVLILSPWLFSFANQVYVPHVVMGVIILLSAIITDPVPEYMKSTSGPVPPH